MTNHDHNAERSTFGKHGNPTIPPFADARPPLRAPGRASPHHRYATTSAVAPLARDLKEARDAERAPDPHVGPFARDGLRLDDAKRDFVMRAVAAVGVPPTERAIRYVLNEIWTPEVAERFGRPPTIETVRRWIRIFLGRDDAFHHGSPAAKAAVERLHMDLRRALGGAALQRFREPWPARRPARRVAAYASAGPAVGEIVEVDGVARRYLGRTAGGRVAYAELSAAPGRRPAVRTGPVQGPSAD